MGFNGILSTGAWARSWSINCPICITKTVVSSVPFEFVATAVALLTFLADGKSTPLFAVLGAVFPKPSKIK